MKKTSIILLSLFLTGLASINASELPNIDKYSTVSVNSQIIKEVAPDTAILRFYIKNQGLNVTDLKLDNDKIANVAIAEIKKNLSSFENLKTIQYRINKIYSYKDKVSIFQKYEVVNGFEVKLKDLNKIASIIDIAFKSGVKDMDNIKFIVENSEDICNNMIQEASKIAKKRAQVTANAVGTILDKPKQITPYCSLDNRNCAPRMYNSGVMNSYKMMDEAQINPINIGNLNVEATVNLIYYLK